MKKLLIAVFVMAFAITSITAMAETTKRSHEKIGQVATDNTDLSQQVLATINKKFPATHVTSVTKAPMGNLYEVVMGKNIAYVDPKVDYFIFGGHIFDMLHQHDLTQDRVEELNSLDFTKLPLKLAIKVVKGDGKRVFAVFTDPECPYCRELEHNLAEVDNYTMYVFLYPIPELHPGARDKAHAIWCSIDPAAAFHQTLTDGTSTVAAKPECTSDPVDEVAAIGHSLGISGTPTLIHQDGRHVPGSMPPVALENWLNGKMPSGQPIHHNSSN